MALKVIFHRDPRGLPRGTGRNNVVQRGPFAGPMQRRLPGSLPPLFTERTALPENLQALFDLSLIGTSESRPDTNRVIAHERLPTDPVYNFTLTLNNIVVGSLYVVTRADNGDSLAIGVATESPTIIPGVPAYSPAMLMDISVRKGSEAPFYKIFDTAAYSAIAGTSVYVLQQQE